MIAGRELGEDPAYGLVYGTSFGPSEIDSAYASASTTSARTWRVDLTCIIEAHELHKRPTANEVVTLDRGLWELGDAHRWPCSLIVSACVLLLPAVNYVRACGALNQGFPDDGALTTRIPHEPRLARFRKRSAVAPDTQDKDIAFSLRRLV